jgi:hypothetical protein
MLRVLGIFNRVLGTGKARWMPINGARHERSALVEHDTFAAMNAGDFRDSIGFDVECPVDGPTSHKRPVDMEPHAPKVHAIPQTGKEHSNALKLGEVTRQGTRRPIHDQA